MCRSCCDKKSGRDARPPHDTLPMTWPWLTLAGLGLFHGLNPGMGWLFAVALGLHRQSRRVVLVSLAPIAFGHALSVGVVAGAFLALGAVVDGRSLRVVAALALLAWAGWHAVYGHRHRVRVGMTTGLAGLALWSFLMATAHGAGLMLVPVLMPLCAAATAAGDRPVAVAAAGVAVHSLAMLAITAALAIAVYEWIGVAILRRAWFNFDVVWTAALIVTAVVVLLV